MPTLRGLLSRPGGPTKVRKAPRCTPESLNPSRPDLYRYYADCIEDIDAGQISISHENLTHAPIRRNVNSRQNKHLFR